MDDLIVRDKWRTAGASWAKLQPARTLGAFISLSKSTFLMVDFYQHDGKASARTIGARHTSAIYLMRD